MGINVTPNNIPDIEYMTDRLATLCRIPSPSGDTQDAVEWIKGQFEELGYKPVITHKGGLLVTVPGAKKGPERALSAHVDTLGAMVFEIKSNGRLKLTLIGGSPWPSLEGEHVVIRSGDGKRYTGSILVTKAASHVWGQETEEVGHGASYGIPGTVREFIAVDMGCVGDGLLGSEYTVSICAKGGGGPYDVQLRKRLEGLCEKNNIAYVVDIFPYYGSDAGPLLRAGHDVRCACVGTGVDASHSHERTHKEGLLATARLVTAYVLSE